MGTFFTILLTLVAVEYFYRVSLLVRAQAMLSIGQRAVRTILSKKISDHWKEVALLLYAKIMIADSLILFFQIAGCILLVGITAAILDRLASPAPSTVSIIASGHGVLVMTVTTIGYLLIRKRYVRK